MDDEFQGSVWAGGVVLSPEGRASVCPGKALKGKEGRGDLVWAGGGVEGVAPTRPAFFFSLLCRTERNSSFFLDVTRNSRELKNVDR